MRAEAGGVGVVLLRFSIIGWMPRPAMNLRPDVAATGCEGPTALPLRAEGRRLQSLTVDPAATTRVEAWPTYVGSQPLSMVVAGHGTAMLGSGKSELDYLCLIAPSGEAVFVDVQTLSGTTILAECATA